MISQGIASFSAFGATSLHPGGRGFETLSAHSKAMLRNDLQHGFFCVISCVNCCVNGTEIGTLSRQKSRKRCVCGLASTMTVRISDNRLRELRPMVRTQNDMNPFADAARRRRLLFQDNPFFSSQVRRVLNQRDGDDIGADEDAVPSEQRQRCCQDRLADIIASSKMNSAHRIYYYYRCH